MSGLNSVTMRKTKLTVPTLSLSKLEARNLDSVSESGVMRIPCNLASIRVRFIAVGSGGAGGGFAEDNRAITL
jgi:hypothetical protein